MDTQANQLGQDLDTNSIFRWREFLEISVKLGLSEAVHPNILPINHIVLLDLSLSVPK